LEDVQFLDTQTGFISGSGIVLYTDNGGLTWQLRSSGVFGETNGLYFSDANTGWVVNESGQIFHTQNAGLSWVAENTGISTILNDVFVTSNGAGWAVGDGGVILHKAAPTAIEPKPVVARTVNLLQNYPNPFNPGTTIAFELSHPAEVRIFVYNLLGEQVAKVAENPYSAGRHQVAFTADNLPSGVYFYELKTENTVKLKKMVLLK
jgi:photosystem II stability/assembly factor-like uncharacterized protein